MFQAVLISYWLALSTWFGGVLFVAAAAPVIFRTVRESDPTLPTVLSVNLESQHGELLAGSIVNNLLGLLLKAELACAAVLGLAIFAQWFIADRAAGALVPMVLRTGLWAAAAGIVLYDWRVIYPRINRYRDAYVRDADDPDLANPAKEQFDRYGAESVNLLLALLFLLLGIILFSGTITPAGAVTYNFGG